MGAEFADLEMSNAYNGKKTKAEEEDSGYLYFNEYLKGMGKPTTAYHWAWHACADGKDAQGKLKAVRSTGGAGSTTS